LSCWDWIDPEVNGIVAGRVEGVAGHDQHRGIQRRYRALKLRAVSGDETRIDSNVARVIHDQGQTGMRGRGAGTRADIGRVEESNNPVCRRIRRDLVQE
jgi:hypothetical protein